MVPAGRACVRHLRARIRRKDLAGGKLLHARIIMDSSISISISILVANTLLDMYASCGRLKDARRLFDSMPARNLYSWTVIISAYGRHRKGDEALVALAEMEARGLTPNKVVLVAVLKTCVTLEWGKRVHSSARKNGLDSDVFVSNALIVMYMKCGSCEDAVRVFDGMRGRRDVITWTAMISGYARIGYGDQALALFKQMQQDNIIPDGVTFVSVIKSCASLQDLKQVHQSITRDGFEKDPFIGTALVNMYAKLGSVEEAENVFNQMCVRDIIAWTTMIASYAQSGHGKSALKLFEGMEREGVRPNEMTYVSILNACGSLAALEWGRRVHANIARVGYTKNPFVHNSLVDMYAKCGSLEIARRIFDRLRQPDVVTWSALIAGYAHHGQGQEALALFEAMQREDVSPNKTTYVSMLKACASTIFLGQQIHDRLKENGLDKDLYVGNALIDMYAQSGKMEDAQQLFEGMCERDVVSWNTLIAGYVREGRGKEALLVFEQMQQAGVQADGATFVSALKACGGSVALDKGKEIHACTKKTGFDADLVVGNALVNMYVKCGSLEDAWQVFDAMQVRDVVSWSAIIAGYAHSGHGMTALGLFERMEREGVKPDKVAFSCVLTACRNDGLMDDAERLFNSMTEDYGIAPSIEHYACIAHLLGHIGCVPQAEDFINKMPIPPDVSMWMTLLTACRVHGNVESGRRAFECIAKLDPERARHMSCY